MKIFHERPCFSVINKKQKVIWQAKESVLEHACVSMARQLVPHKSLKCLHF